MLSPGDSIDGRYEIIEPLAEGGMGAVYRARRVLLGDDVAIKIVKADDASPSARERFLRESRVAAGLRHPGIVSILDFDMPGDGPPYLVMELLSGPSLLDEIRQRGRLDPGDVARILPSVCSALELTHASGIVHRDLKPANIVAHVYADGGRAYKIVDFGIANLRQSSDETRLTGAHQFVGTIAYASPEQLSGGEIDGRSDVYSLAAVVYEMLTGAPPFTGPDVMTVLSRQLTALPQGVRATREDVPEALESAIARGLAKDPADRWASVAEFAAALNAALGGGASDPPAASGGALHRTYEIGEFLGPGRLGSEVYRGVHRAMGHPVAIRLLRRRARANWDAARQRFLREAQAMQIPHPSIIQVRDFGEEHDAVFVVTDFIAGSSAREVLTADGPLPWARLRPLLAQLFDAARLLHRRDALLCGMHPDIMRICPAEEDEDEGERLKISTAGIWCPQDLLATLSERTLRGMGIDDVELRYVPPEVLTGGTVDVRSDVFTLGVIAYELATGRRPYEGRTMHELLGQMLAGAVGNPRALGADMPDAAADAILRALRPAASERFASPRDFSAAL